MSKRSYYESLRFGVSVDPRFFDWCGEYRGAWHESPEEANRVSWRARRRAVLMAWLRLQMMERLTSRERECVELHFFLGLSYAAAGRRTHTHATSVFRGVRRALRKLCEARDADDSWRLALERLHEAERRARPE